MKSKILILKLLVLCFMLSLFFVSPPPTSAHGLIPDSMVPCGYGTLPPCDICQLWHLADHLINFLIFGLLGPLIIIALIWGGFTYMTSGGDPKKVSQGTSIMTSAIIGLFIAALGWLIVDTVIKTLANRQLAFSAPTFINFAWNEIAECPKPKDPPEVDLDEDLVNLLNPHKDIGNFDKTLNAQLADSLIGSAGTSSTCKNTSGVPVSAATTIREIANSQPVTVCSVGCKTQNTCTQRPQIAINTGMLVALQTLDKDFNITISSITTGDHGVTSCHYAGNCVDVVAQQKRDYPAIQNQLKVLGNTVFCETRSGKQAVCSTAGVSDQQDPIDHIHASF